MAEALVEEEYEEEDTVVSLDSVTLPEEEVSIDELKRTLKDKLPSD